MYCIYAHIRYENTFSVIYLEENFPQRLLSAVCCLCQVTTAVETADFLSTEATTAARMKTDAI